MISIPLLIYILALHYIGDFILQPYWMSLQKSENFKILLCHVGLYTLVMYVGLIFTIGIVPAFKFAFLNGLLHLLVDYVTSKIISDNSSELLLDPDQTKPIHKRLQLWGPISLLGFDQLLHQSFLLLAFYFSAML